jgi:hypothetical protein
LLFCQVLWNLTIPKKTQKFSKHPISTKSSSSSRRHCKTAFCEFQNLLYSLNFLTAKFKQKSGGGVLNNWGERDWHRFCVCDLVCKCREPTICSD